MNYGAEPTEEVPILSKKKRARSKTRPREDLASCRSETLGHTETDDAWVEREDIRAEAGVVAVRKGVSYRRVVEQILDIKLHRELRFRPFQRHRQIGIVPCAQPVIFGVVNARIDRKSTRLNSSH